MRAAMSPTNDDPAAPVARRFCPALLLVALLVTTAVGAATFRSAGAQQPSFAPRDETPEQFPNHPGREDAFYACTACHGFMLVAQQGMARWQWDETIELMIDKHSMPAPDDKDRKIMLDYLEQAFPARAPKGPPGWKNPFGDR
jgi:hypothetical protein